MTPVPFELRGIFSCRCAQPRPSSSSSRFNFCCGIDISAFTRSIRITYFFSCIQSNYTIRPTKIFTTPFISITRILNRCHRSFPCLLRLDTLLFRGRSRRPISRISHSLFNHPQKTGNKMENLTSSLVALPSDLLKLAIHTPAYLLLLVFLALIGLALGIVRPPPSHPLTIHCP